MDDRDIYVTIHASIAYLMPPKTKEEEIRRRQADYEIQEMASRMRKGVAELLKAQCEGKQ